eukprot:m.262086 g.262086  ORF g.262086 m.262086 type:complete len:146 (+) comp44360_c0_seq1:427-864(+)
MRLGVDRCVGDRNDGDRVFLNGDFLGVVLGVGPRFGVASFDGVLELLLPALLRDLADLGIGAGAGCGVAGLRLSGDMAYFAGSWMTSGALSSLLLSLSDDDDMIMGTLFTPRATPTPLVVCTKIATLDQPLLALSENGQESSLRR